MEGGGVAVPVGGGIHWVADTVPLPEHYFTPAPHQRQTGKRAGGGCRGTRQRTEVISIAH